MIEFTANIATILGFPAAIVGLVYAGLQLRKSARVSEGQFMLDLERMIATHDPVHLKLRPGGAWSLPHQGPSTAEDWAAVEDYMGLFEHCEILIKYGSLDANNFASLFAYRISNILNNQIIVAAKLESDERMYWSDFLALIDRLKRLRWL